LTGSLCFGLNEDYQLPRFWSDRLIESRARLDATQARAQSFGQREPVLVVWTDHALP
jgi:hypothetical protein